MEEEYEAAGGEVLLESEDNDGWLATHGKPKGMFLTEFCLCLCITYLTLCLCIFLFFLEGKSEEDEDLPSMESLEISKNDSVKPTSSSVRAEEEDDIPDMEEFEEADNIIITDPVSYSNFIILEGLGLYE